MQSQNIPFLNIDSGEDKLYKLRIRLLKIILGFMILVNVAFVIANLWTNQATLFEGIKAIAPVSLIIAIGFFIAVSRHQLIRLSSTIVIMYLILVGVFLFSLVQDTSLLFLVLALSALSSALLSSRLIYWGINVVTALLIIIAATISIAQPTDILFVSPIISILLTLTFGLVPMIIGAIARYFVNDLEATARRAQRSANLLLASADIGKNVSEILTLDKLLSGAVDIIKDRFAFYHVSLFLTDKDKRYSHLTASTGDIGERMLANEYRLLIDSNSVVGRSTQAQDVIVVRNIENEASYSYSESLQGIRSELAVPIVDKEGVIGVIDIQSLRTDAFTVTEIEALQVIANQLATAIRNARLFEDKENNIRENKRLFIESETNLREIQRLNRQLTKQAWTDYLQTDRRINGVTWSETNFQNRANWSDEMVTASQKRRAITEEKDGIRTIALPIELRGEVVGAIEIETESNKNKDDVIDMVQAISQRLGVSLDNARLFEESNEATAQEQRVSEIVAQYQSADSVDELLRLTVKGLAETLGADHASIRLGVVPNISTLDDSDDDGASNNGDVSI